MHDHLSDIGLIGLAVMGQNLALNIADHGFAIAVYNRTYAKTESFLKENQGLQGNLRGYERLKDFVASLSRPRKILIMVQAGAATDAVIQELIPLLEKGDIIIDGGNAHWLDTIAREKRLKALGLHLLGSGVSGGEEGARFGPSLMPGGDFEAWKALETIWTAIAAKVDSQTGKPLMGASPGKPIVGGQACTAYIGENGSGHYVKMVHNGIEYSDMQLICEGYDMLRQLLGLKPDAMGAIFETWNQGVLDSFLIEITAKVLKQKDPMGEGFLVDKILDVAGQKGTGKWTAMHSLELGVTAPTIAESVFARCISALKAEREHAAALLPGPNHGHKGINHGDTGANQGYTGDSASLIQAIHDALYCSKICSYAQGFQLLQAAQKEYQWSLHLGEIAKVWRGGCIIRAAFLQKITEAYEKAPQLPNLLLDDYFRQTLLDRQANWRRVVALAAEYGVPTPTFASALAYFDSYRSAHLPQNLLQGLRDCFGAHTYERVDAPRGQHFHLEWAQGGRQVPVHK